MKLIEKKDLSQIKAAASSPLPCCMAATAIVAGCSVATTSGYISPTTRNMLIAAVGLAWAYSMYNVGCYCVNYSTIRKI